MSGSLSTKHADYRGRWVLIGGFIVLQVIAAGWHLASALRPDRASAGNPARAAFSGVTSQNLLLRSIEENFGRTAPAVSKARELWQGLLLNLLREGNQRVFVAPDKTLRYRPSLEAICGPGPMARLPRSVARPTPDEEWVAPLPVILDFNRQLAAQGITLWLVPIPSAPLSSDRPLPRHKESAAFYRELEQAGVVLHFPFATRERDIGDLFMKTDTHWTATGAKLAAGELVLPLRTALGLSEVSVPDGMPTSSMPQERNGLGDLAVLLGMSANAAETVPAANPPGPEAGLNAEMIWLGDSFTNMFHDSSLGFGTGAGITDWLAAHLGAGFPVIAKNGGGASEVRRELARRAASLPKPKIVVWALAERDLFLGERLSRELKVKWDFVALPADWDLNQITPAETTNAIISARVVSVSALPDPGSVPYADCLMVVVYELQTAFNGLAPGARLHVVHWGFRGRKPDPAAGLRPGDVVRLQLEAFTEQTAQIQSTQLADDTGELEDQFWAVSWTSPE